MSINPTLAHALSQAQALGLPRIDAQLLLLHTVGRLQAGRAWLLAHDQDELTPEEHAHYLALCQRRHAGEPVAYLTGVKEFFGLTLQVDARVLDPRPDTETLVEWALEVAHATTQAAEAAEPRPPLRIIDLGTGSGAIALALQHQLPGAAITAVDASADALAVAQANGERLDLPVRCVLANWLEGVEGRFDVIASNPPYIRSDDPHLAALTHEPLSALASGADGLADIRSIVAQAPAHLVPGGWLLLEHGWDQAAAVAALLTQAGFTQVQHRNDLAGMARCTGGQWQPSVPSR